MQPRLQLIVLTEKSLYNDLKSSNSQSEFTHGQNNWLSYRKKNIFRFNNKESYLLSASGCYGKWIKPYIQNWLAISPKILLDHMSFN